MKINYILTAFSTAMFGDGATVHIRSITKQEAEELVSSDTRIMATRVSHEKLARQLFPDASNEVVRYAMLTPGVSAIHVHYRGPQIPDSGEIPANGLVTYYLVEAEEYQSE